MCERYIRCDRCKAQYEELTVFAGLELCVHCKIIVERMLPSMRKKLAESLGKGISKMEMDEFNRISMERRKKLFEVKLVNPSRDADLYPGAIDLEITSNGSGWMSFRLMPDEVPKVAEALLELMMSDKGELRLSDNLLVIELDVLEERIRVK